MYQFTAIFASGLTPMIATALTGWYDGQPWYLCAYFLFWGIVSSLCAVALYRMSNRRKVAAERESETVLPAGEICQEA